ncbi:MAG: phytoene desaturase family protein, partial [Actinomycetota bacterium]
TRCHELGVEIRTGESVEKLISEPSQITVSSLRSKQVFENRAKIVLANCAPAVLEKIAGIPAPKLRDGCQLKINMVVKQLPELKSGVDPRKAFAGTFHINESYFQLERAYEEAREGKIPTEIPSEMYCHTLTDSSILSEELRDRGFHTLTLFALHLPASLFDIDHDRVKEEVVKRTLAGLNDYLVNPIERYLALDSNGEPCIEVKTPQELESALGLPRGNIFHTDLEFPWKSDDDQRKWGVETSHDRILLAGSGALRGGAVSGIAGHNAAMAALERLKELN